jgi:hypothetical protein
MNVTAQTQTTPPTREQEPAAGRCPPLPPMTPERSALLLAELEEACARRGLPGPKTGDGSR